MLRATLLFAIITLVLLALTDARSLNVNATRDIQRLSSYLPYPQPPWTPSIVYFIDTTTMTEAEHLFVLTLKGILAKQLFLSQSTPLIYTADSLATSPETVYWSAYNQQYAAVTKFDETMLNATATELISAFAKHIDGYYLVTIETDSVNVGVSLAATSRSHVVATHQLVAAFTKHNIPMIADVRNVTEVEFVSQYGPNNFPFSKRFISNQQISKAPVALTDFTILLGAIQVTTLESYTSIIKWIASNGPVNVAFGWIPTGSDEHGYVTLASQTNAMVLASDWSNNLATHIMFQPNQTIINPTKSILFPLPNNNNKHTVTLFYSDGDNICSDMNLLLDNTHFNSIDRGSVSVGWGINPTLAHVAPIGLQTYYSRSNASYDSFIGFSAGYAYGNDMSDDTLKAWATETNIAMQAADIHVMNYIADTFDQRTTAALHAQPAIDATFFMPYYNNYVPVYPYNGTVQWSNGKPAISMRDSLWADHSTPQSVAALVNALSTNHTTVDAYSAIVIHIWSMTMTDVKTCIELMDKNRVVVVKPDQFAQLMVNNVKPTLSDNLSTI